MANISKANSISRYIEIILKKKDKLNLENSVTQLWYRGESNSEWKTPIVPGSYRILAETLNKESFISDNIKATEQNITAEFNRRAVSYSLPQTAEDNVWQMYFLMQHYGIKTRLLDWTENALIALFFAVESKEFTDKDAIVWILQPFKLNDFSIKRITKRNHSCLIIPPTTTPSKKQSLFNDNDQIRLNELTRRYIKMDFEDNKVEYYPLAIYPTYFDNRMSGQKTCFTIFGNKINGLFFCRNKNRFLDKIIIDKKSKTKIRKDLVTLGIDHESVYPDLAGLGQSIMEKHGNSFFDNRELLPMIFKKFENK